MQTNLEELSEPSYIGKALTPKISLSGNIRKSPTLKLSLTGITVITLPAYWTV